MPNLDQKTYDDLIQEALTLRDHLDEWRDQFSEIEPEATTVSTARGATVDVIQALVTAKSENRYKHERKIGYALKRVAEGTSTQQDAILLRDALHMGPIQ